MVKVMATYKELDGKLQGRCRESRKVANNTYLKRDHYKLKDIAVHLHSTDILIFHPNGDIWINTGGWDTPTTRDRINMFLPTPWSVGGHRGHTLLYSHTPERWTPVRVIDNSLTIRVNGSIDGGGEIKELMDRIRRDDLEAARPRNRARYWTNKAHGLFTDRSGCTAANRWNCDTRSRRFRRGQMITGVYDCGCRVYFEQPSIGKLTVAKILAEENQTVRLAMMRVYGFDKFVLESDAKIIAQQAGYELLELPLDRWNKLKVLKMKCSTTGAVYINQVPPNCDNVPAAVDWMFDTEDYLGQIRQQT
jgi:hypothetical protein